MENREILDTALRHTGEVARPAGDIASKGDVWLPLAVAGQYLRLHAPEEFSALKRRYGFATLKKLVVATELFDVENEPTNKGGTRTV